MRELGSTGRRGLSVAAAVLRMQFQQGPHGGARGCQTALSWDRSRAVVLL